LNHKFKNYLIYIYISKKNNIIKKKKLPSCCDLIRQTRDSYHELNWVQFFFPEIYIQPKKKKNSWVYSPPHLGHYNEEPRSASEPLSSGPRAWIYFYFFY
jgi:hypothetical protein